jgi:hypothetical protein
MIGAIIGDVIGSFVMNFTRLKPPDLTLFNPLVANSLTTLCAPLHWPM